MIKDKSNMIAVLDSFKQQCIDAFKLAKKSGIKLNKNIDNIFVCGMGSSAIGGNLIKPFVKKVPVILNRDYGLPGFASSRSLVFIVTYSGTTEETLSAYSEARKKKSQIIVITSNPQLAKKEKNSILVPSGYQPRNAIAYLFLTIIAVLEDAKLVPKQNITEAARLLVPKTCSKEGFMLGKAMKGIIPIIYATADFEGAAYRLKTQINENAKQTAYCSIIPEMNHNEINGFKHGAKKLHIFMIKDKNDSKRNKKRMEITKQILRDFGIRTTELHTKGNSLLERMLYTIYIGDYSSYYLALMNNEDPSIVPVIQDLKKSLKEKHIR